MPGVTPQCLLPVRMRSRRRSPTSVPSSLSASLPSSLPASLPTSLPASLYASQLQPPLAHRVHQSSRRARRRVLDDAMATIAEKMVGSERLESRVDDFLQVESNPQTAWAHWMGTEMTTIHDDLLSAFFKDSFQLLMNY